MASPVFVGALTLEDVLELPADELRDELAGRYIEAKGLSKVEMQKVLIKALSPVAPVVSQPVSPRSFVSAATDGIRSHEDEVGARDLREKGKD